MTHKELQTPIQLDGATPSDIICQVLGKGIFGLIYVTHHSCTKICTILSILERSPSPALGMSTNTTEEILYRADSDNGNAGE